jgi:hypothetical protein
MLRSESAFAFGRAITDAGIARTQKARVKILECMVAVWITKSLIKRMNWYGKTSGPAERMGYCEK